MWHTQIAGAPLGRVIDRFGVMNGPKATSAFSPFDSRLRTLVDAARRLHSCQFRPRADASPPDCRMDSGLNQPIARENGILLTFALVECDESHLCPMNSRRLRHAHRYRDRDRRDLHGMVVVRRGVIHRGPRGCFCATASAAAFSSASMTIEIRVPAPGLDLRVPAPAACARVNSAHDWD
jgi:hypothetical protein